MITQHSTWRFKLSLPTHNTERNRQDKVKCEKVMKKLKASWRCVFENSHKIQSKIQAYWMYTIHMVLELTVIFFFWNITHQALNFLSLLPICCCCCCCCCFFFFSLLFFPIQESGLKQYYQSQQECIFPSVLLTFSVGLVNCLYLYVYLYVLQKS